MKPILEALPEEQSKKRGRKPAYDRDAIITQLVTLADKEGIRGRSLRSLGDELAEWYADHNGGKGPAAKTVRNFISRYLPDLPEEDDN